MSKTAVYAEGGKVSGRGYVTHKDGTRTDIVFSSDPLTKEQADQINARPKKITGAGAASCGAAKANH